MEKQFDVDEMRRKVLEKLLCTAADNLPDDDLLVNWVMANMTLAMLVGETIGTLSLGDQWLQEEISETSDPEKLRALFITRIRAFDHAQLALERALAPCAASCQ